MVGHVMPEGSAQQLSSNPGCSMPLLLPQRRCRVSVSLFPDRFFDLTGFDLKQWKCSKFGHQETHVEKRGE